MERISDPSRAVFELYSEILHCTGCREDEKLRGMVKRVEGGEYEAELDELTKLDQSALKKPYEERDFESVKEEMVLSTPFLHSASG